MIDQDTRRRFDELLPWYVNGTLDSAGRNWLEQKLREHPELHGEHAWTESLQQHMRESAPDVSADIGLDRLMARIRYERKNAAVRAPVAKAPGGLLAGIAGFFERFQLAPGLAMAAAVVLAQFGVIGVLLSEQGQLQSEFERFRSVSSGQIVTGPALEVIFKSDARERDIREALVRVGGTLAGGPGQLGVYLVYVPAGEIEQARSLLEQNAIVELVTIAKAPRAGNGS